MAKTIVLSKMNHKTQSQMFAINTYTGKEETGPMVLKPVRIGKNLEQWLQEIHKEQEVRKQA